MLLTNLRASMGAVCVRHRLWGMSFVTHMSLSAPGNTHPSARQPQEGEVQATKMIPGMVTSCCGGIQAAPRAGASSAPATSRHWSVQDYHEIVLPESQCVCTVTVSFSATKQQPEEARLNTRGIFIIIVQMENTYQATGCPSFPQTDP